MPKKIANADLHRLSVQAFKEIAKRPIVVILDNIRSQHNIGAAFRTSDAFLIEKIYLCGICATPPSAQIHKSALGAEDSVDWEYCEQTLSVVQKLKQQGYTIIAIEQVEGALRLENFSPEPRKKYALVFGNEVSGVDAAVVDAADGFIEIPQFGTKHSLNVSVSIGIVLWEFIK